MKFKMKNRSAGIVAYSIEDLNINRRFTPGEVKEVTLEEVEKLLYKPGGRTLFVKYLQVPANIMEKLGFDEQEPEYYYTEEDIKRIMTTGSYDEFLDFLDFAPAGGISVAKDLAIKLPLADMNKADALSKATGFDIMKALSHMKAVEEDLNGGQEPSAETRTRRVVKQPEAPKYRRIDN